MVPDVPDLGGVGFGIDEDIRAVEVEPHQPRYGLPDLATVVSHPE